MNTRYSVFRVRFDDLDEEFEVPLFGAHMVLNATAAIAMCYKLGIKAEDIKEALRDFRNATRRMEESQLGKGITLIDDYAHHPTEIAATISSVRQKYPQRKVVAIFKPNTYSRTVDFTEGFIKALGQVDKVYLTEIDSNRERQEDYPGVSSRMITDGIEGSRIVDENVLDNLEVEPGEVLLVMSCASVSHLIENIKKKYR